MNNIIGNNYRVGIYMRLSREDEIKNGESESIKNQRNYILEYMKKEGLFVVTEYVDDGVSGTTFDRVEFNRMIEDIENKKINMVVTKDFSRLGRDYIEAGKYVEKYFPEKRIRYVAINDGIDTYTDTLGNEMLGFKAVINDLYCKDISKKIKSTLTTKKKQGLFLGSSAPYGYKKNPDNKYHLIVDFKASEVIRSIYKMFLEGKSAQKIARHLSELNIPRPSVYKGMEYKYSSKTRHLWDERTIIDILKNPNYTGNLVQGRRKKINYKSKKIIDIPKSEWIIVPNTHEAIIDKETFQLVQDIYEKNKNITYKSTNLLLRGFLYCKECKHTLGINTSKDKTRHYTVCNHYRKYSKQNFCTSHSMRYEELERKIFNDVLEKFNKFVDINELEKVLKNNNKKNRDLEEIDKRIENTKSIIETFKQNIKDMYIDKLNNVITSEMYQEIFDRLQNDINLNEVVINNLTIEKTKLLKTEVKCENYRDKIKNYLFYKNPSRKLLASIIDRIEIDENKNIDIYYKIKSKYL